MAHVNFGLEDLIKGKTNLVNIYTFTPTFYL
jgi:hypothetical protein